MKELCDGIRKLLSMVILKRSAILAACTIKAAGLNVIMPRLRNGIVNPPHKAIQHPCIISVKCMRKVMVPKRMMNKLLSGI